MNEGEKNVASEKPAGEVEATDVNKENPANEAAEEKEPEEKVNIFYFYFLDILIIPKFTFSWLIY